MWPLKVSSNSNDSVIKSTKQTEVQWANQEPGEGNTR